MESEILGNLNKLCRLNKIRPSENIMEHFGGTIRNGYYYLFGAKVKNKDKLLDVNEYEWVLEVKLIIRDTNSIISLNYVNHMGETITVRPKENVTDSNTSKLSYLINDNVKLITFTLSPEGNDITIEGVQIIGYKTSDYMNIIKTLDELWSVVDENNIKTESFLSLDIKNKSVELNQLRKDIENSKTSLEELDKSNELAQSQLDSTRNYINDERKQLDTIKKDVINFKNEDEKIKKSINLESKKLADIISNSSAKQEKLDALKSDLAIFTKEAALYSEDFSAYKKEIDKQNLFYAFFLLVFSVSFIVFIVNIYNSAAYLVDNFQFNFDLWTLFVSKLPIISINIFILGVFSTLVYQCINLITNNFEKISTLKQITYLVKECVDAQSEGVEASPDEIVKLRVEKKMELIKEHLLFKSS
ncbi:hypothetical protein [Vibrio fluvialis]|uniref:hypothetical protein n=1 Tax=Vibrio fluvialis TaxID=676 RepID=UPI001302A471|nr:hypothetical protein [Vibrio fluvialis]